MLTAKARGLGWAVAAAGISGVAVFLNSLLIKGIDPLVHTTIKNAWVGLFIVGLLMITKEWRQAARLTGKQWLKLAGIAVIGGSFAFALFFTGLKQIGAVEGQLLNKTLVVWVALLAVPMLKEKVSGKMILGILLIYASSLVGVNFKSSSLVWGHLMVLGATLLWSLETILVKKTLTDVPVNIAVGARMGMGSLILFLMLFITDKTPLISRLTLTQWGWLLLVGVILFGYVSSWYRALAILPATLVTAILTGAIVITNTLNSLFVTHAYSLENLIQALLIITGAGIVYLAAGRYAPVSGTEVKINELNN